MAAGGGGGSHLESSNIYVYSKVTCHLGDAFNTQIAPYYVSFGIFLKLLHEFITLQLHLYLLFCFIASDKSLSH